MHVRSLLVVRVEVHAEAILKTCVSFDALMCVRLPLAALCIGGVLSPTHAGVYTKGCTNNNPKKTSTPRNDEQTERSFTAVGIARAWRLNTDPVLVRVRFAAPAPAFRPAPCAGNHGLP